MKGLPEKDPFIPTFHPDRLNDPLKTRKSYVIGMSFLGDILDFGITLDQIRQINEVAWKCQQMNIGHRLIFLTKKADRLAGIPYPWPDNCWWGVTVCDQQGLGRLEWLKKANVKHRWISHEPVLEPVDFIGHLSGIDQMIMGCESGPNARAMPIRAVMETEEACDIQAVPFYLKQMMVDGVLVHMPEVEGKIWDELVWR